ncbi:hypothetical protein [Streptomyces sp. NPDC049879]|uniref:hypothetical protein n=1 Tax=Streptomyces sp. NPDC049879 TaxID=3365598 RepID=UPI0037AEAF04
MDASTITAVASLAFALGVLFSMGLGLGLAAAVKLVRRIERLERRIRQTAPAQAGGHHYDPPSNPPAPRRSGTGGPSTMVRPRTAAQSEVTARDAVRA